MVEVNTAIAMRCIPRFPRGEIKFASCHGSSYCSEVDKDDENDQVDENDEDDPNGGENVFQLSRFVLLFRGRRGPTRPPLLSSSVNEGPSTLIPRESSLLRMKGDGEHATFPIAIR